MVELDVKALAAQMLEAASAALEGKPSVAKTYAEMEFKKLAATAASIQTAKLADEIDEEDARILMDMQKNATRAVLLAVEGLGAIAAQQAINAAVDAVKGPVNGVLGFALL